jgi:hypothetical protein
LFKSFIPWVTLAWGINVAFSTFVFTMCSITLFFINPRFSFHPCACSVLQLSWVSTLTNQSTNFETLLFPKKTNVSMAHGKTQLMFMCSGLNVILIETPPSINLQQDP